MTFIKTFIEATSKDDSMPNFGNDYQSLLASEVGKILDAEGNPTGEYYARDSDEYLADWSAKGSPRCWVLVEEYNKYQAWIDHGHGLVALYNTESSTLSWSKNGATLNEPEGDVTALDKDYYGHGSYIFFSTEWLNSHFNPVRGKSDVDGLVESFYAEDLAKLS